jgi:hypothetical protein
LHKDAGVPDHTRPTAILSPAARLVRTEIHSSTYFNLMKTAPQLDPRSAADDVAGSSYNLPDTATVTDYAYQLVPAPIAAAPKTAPTTGPLNFKTLRALGQQVFGAEAAREYLHEVILFACIFAVAAWPLSVTLNQLGTMMISPPPWVP